MRNKKNIIILFFILINFSITSEGYNHINGVWESFFVYDNLIKYQKKNRLSLKEFTWGEGKYFPNSGLIIDILETGKGSFWDGNSATIDSVEEACENIFIINCSKDGISLGAFIINFIEEEIVTISGFTFGEGLVYEQTWHRISGPAKIKPQPGKINDERVRLRTKPELNSDTWGFLNKGDKVRIVDRSNEKQKIGDMESYWYKVQTEGYPDGWVYGAYIDVE